MRVLYIILVDQLIYTVIYWSRACGPWSGLTEGPGWLRSDSVILCLSCIYIYLYLASNKNKKLPTFAFKKLFQDLQSTFNVNLRGLRPIVVVIPQSGLEPPYPTSWPTYRWIHRQLGLISTLPWWTELSSGCLQALCGCVCSLRWLVSRVQYQQSYLFYLVYKHTSSFLPTPSSATR